MSRRKLSCGLLGWLAVASLGGCSTAPLEKEINVEELKNVEGKTIYHEWKKIYSTSFQGQQSRRHVGFLDRRFSLENPEGITFVRDREHRERGFMTPEGKAFAFKLHGDELIETADLGNTGFDNGVKRILEVPGAVEYETVREASTAPPAAE